MKCLSCDVILNDYESTKKYASTGDYIDLFGACFASSDVPLLDTLDRPDLSSFIMDEVEED